jgi:hypothetical protein
VHGLGPDPGASAPLFRRASKRARRPRPALPDRGVAASLLCDALTPSVGASGKRPRTLTSPITVRTANRQRLGHHHASSPSAALPHRTEGTELGLGRGGELAGSCSTVLGAPRKGAIRPSPGGCPLVYAAGGSRLRQPLLLFSLLNSGSLWAFDKGDAPRKDREAVASYSRGRCDLVWTCLRSGGSVSLSSPCCFQEGFC